MASPANPVDASRSQRDAGPSNEFGSSLGGAAARRWLNVACKVVVGVQKGILVDGGSGELIASWPVDGDDPDYLRIATNRSRLARREMAMRIDPQARRPDEGPRTVLAQPLLDGRAIVAVEVVEASDDALQASLEQLRWSGEWLDLPEEGRKEASKDRAIATLLDLIATPLEYDNFDAAASAFLNELAVRTSCDRIILGLVERSTVRVRAASHSSRISSQSNLNRAAEEAMSDAYRLEREIAWPVPNGEVGPGQSSHAELSRLSGAAELRSIPFSQGSRWLGVAILERSQAEPFDPRLLETIRVALALAGPILDAAWRRDRGFPQRARDGIHEVVALAASARRLGAKAVIALVGVALLGLALIRIEYRITADTELEADVVRAAVAPFEGYVSRVAVRAGDRVKTGEVLASLDERELRLERARWSSQLEQLEKQYRQAMAEHAAAQIQIINAQRSQANARLTLVAERLSKSQIVAPFDGIVISGEPDQELGAPVERGQVLFEIAPLDSYRVVLHVDERDVREVQIDQSGTLVLKSAPERSIDITVKSITPVSQSGEGRNSFRVEATLDEPIEGLQPGMEGVSRVDTGPRHLVWILTHDVTDWLRLQLWRWLP
jgi:RND family efflux transporter MFP subunit